MGFFDKMKDAAKAATEKATESLKSSGILVTGFQPIPDEIKKLPMGGTITEAPFLEELMKDRKPDTSFGVCLTDTTLYVVEQGRLWKTFDISFSANIDFSIEKINKDISDRGATFIYTIKITTNDKTSITFWDYFTAYRNGSSITEPCLQRLDRIFGGKPYSMLAAMNEVEGDITLSKISLDYFRMRNRLAENNYVWDDEIINRVDPEDEE